MLGQPSLLVTLVIASLLFVACTHARPQPGLTEEEIGYLKSNVELVKGGTGDELVTLEEFKKFYQSVNPNLDDDYLSNLFKKKDTDGDDRLDWKELAMFGDVELFFKALDTDGDQKLSLDEFMGFNKFAEEDTETEQAQIPEEQLRSAHQQLLDKNKDGTLDMKEFEVYVKLIQNEEEQGRATALKDISLFDDNDDALVTMAEYKDKWLSVNPQLNESLITSRFNARDKDGNGILNWIEWGPVLDDDLLLTFATFDLNGNQELDLEEFKLIDNFEIDPEAADKAEMFFIFDQDLDGKMTLQELDKMMELEEFKEGMNVFQIIDFDLLDTDGDGFIEGDEFDKLEKFLVPEEEQTENFDTYKRLTLPRSDLNRDGKLDRREFNIYHKLPPPPDARYIKANTDKAFKVLDQSRDNLVEADEVQNFFRKNRHMILGRSNLPSVEEYQKSIHLFDQDGDGKLNFKEMDVMEKQDLETLAAGKESRPEPASSTPTQDSASPSSAISIKNNYSSILLSVIAIISFL